MKRTLALVAAAVACVTLGGAGTVPALAAAGRATLTSQEYELLSSGETKLQAALNAKPVSWDAVRAVCITVGSSTALMKSERGSCLAETQLLEVLATFPGHERECGSAQPGRDVCLAHLYVGIADNAKAMYQGDLATYQQAARRGFTARCIDALANSTTQLDEQRELAITTERLSSDIQLAAEVKEGKLPSGAISVAQAEADAKAFQHDANLVLNQSSPKLSSCLHQ